MKRWTGQWVRLESKMSYTTIKAVWPGERAEDFAELRNSWGSAPVIWRFLCERYLGKPWYSAVEGQDLWDLWKRQDIPQAYRAVHMLTFDRAYVTKKDYGRMEADIREFCVVCCIDGVNHWPAIADYISHAHVPAIGLHCTSVSEDPFCGPYNEKTEDYDRLDWTTAYNLYESLDRLNEPVAA